VLNFKLTDNLNWKNGYLGEKKIKFSGIQENTKRNSVQVVGIKHNNLYTITYSCPENNCNYYPIYNTLVESFEPVKAKLK